MYEECIKGLIKHEAKPSGLIGLEMHPSTLYLIKYGVLGTLTSLLYIYEPRVRFVNRHHDEQAKTH